MPRSRLLMCCLIIVLTGTFSCAPAPWRKAEQAYEAGDLVTAVRMAAQTLVEEPGYEEAIDFLRAHLTRAYDRQEDLAARAEEAGDWERAFRMYESVQLMSDAVRYLPPQVHPETREEVVFPPRDVAEKLRTARQKTAEHYYASGVRHEEDGRSKDAAKSYSRALEFLPDFRDARERYRRNREAAVKRVAIMPFRNLTGRRWHGDLGAVIADGIVNESMKRPANMEFMELVSRDHLEDIVDEIRFNQSGFVDPSSAAEKGKLLGIHAFVFGKVTGVSVDYPPDVVTTYDEKEEVSDGKDRPKRTVRASVTVVRRQAIARVRCTYQIVDVQRGTIISTGEAEPVEHFELTFGRYRGDKEALSYRSRQLCAIREAYPPPEEELISRAAERAASALSSDITRFFR